MEELTASFEKLKQNGNRLAATAEALKLTKVRFGHPAVQIGIHK